MRQTINENILKITVLTFSVYTLINQYIHHLTILLRRFGGDHTPKVDFYRPYINLFLNIYKFKTNLKVICYRLKASNALNETMELTLTDCSE